MFCAVKDCGQHLLEGLQEVGFFPPIKSNKSALYHPPKNFNIYFKRKEETRLENEYSIQMAGAT